MPVPTPNALSALRALPLEARVAAIAAHALCSGALLLQDAEALGPRFLPLQASIGTFASRICAATDTPVEAVVKRVHRLAGFPMLLVPNNPVTS